MSNKVVVEYDYTAKEPDELTLRKGDVITDVVKKQGGWWEGTLHDKTGMFPDNFVRSLDKDNAVVLRNQKDVTRIRQCRAVFSYDRDHEDELSLKVGDIIDITGEEEEGWWRGVLHGKEGVFPSNFVKEVAWQPSPSLRVSTDPELNGTEHKPPKLPAKPSKQLCEATFPYKAQNEDELSFEEGDLITIVSRDCADPGWWLGEINGKTGVFPDNFVTPVTDSKTNRKSTAIDSKGAIKSVASQRKSIEVKKETVQPETTKPSPVANKPTVSSIKSPLNSGFLTEIKKKIEDTIDGAMSSKAGVEEGPAKETNAFDNVERRPLLTDVRATRAKAPGRRLPTAAAHKDEAVPAESPEEVPQEAPAKPKLREWEKHKAPWLEEMKLNQVRRTLVSSVDENSNEHQHKKDVEKEEKVEKVEPVVGESKRSPEDKRSMEYVLERLERLEGIVRKQARVIEEMQEKLQKLQA
ncbi:unnamed protein product [Phyllotreta striolata]|uniref:SH3 domain-containing protein n=1 Tax=Phyllotreta striolata TaxID=444603 RepID=A0A9P0GTH8_PHYSR|nr:unnamed protein product [Phyllotreta striolata]